MREYQWYCPKCGFKSFLLKSDLGICNCCNTQMIETPHKYNLAQQHWIQSSNDEWEKIEQRLFDEVISQSCEFDINLYKNKDTILQEKQHQQQNSITQGKAILEEKSRIPKCPTCGSTNIEKISLTKKAVGGAMFGLFSSNVRKSMHCKNCDYKW